MSLFDIPVIFMTFRSRRFEDDSAAKVVASLAVSDIVNGIISACCAGVAWSLQPGEQVPEWLLRVITARWIHSACVPSQPINWASSRGPRGSRGPEQFCRLKNVQNHKYNNDMYEFHDI